MPLLGPRFRWSSVSGMKINAGAVPNTSRYRPPPPGAHGRFLGRQWERSRVHQACFDVPGAVEYSSCSLSSCGDLSTTTSTSTDFLVLLGKSSACVEGASAVGAFMSIIPGYVFETPSTYPNLELYAAGFRGPYCVCASRVLLPYNVRDAIEWSPSVSTTSFAGSGGSRLDVVVFFFSFQFSI